MARTIERVAAAMESLARMEERLSESRESLIRAFDSIDDHEKRLKPLERDIGPLKEARKWITGAIISIILLVIGGFVTGNVTIHATAPTADVRAAPR